MADLTSLLNDLAKFDDEHDLDGMRQVRDQILEEFPHAEEAVEALYKVGIDSLFRQRDVAAAMQAFATAAKRKNPFWSQAARLSLGLCHYHQHSLQKALFELRRVAYTEHPNVHSVAALAFLEDIFVREESPDEATKIRKERIKQLEALVGDADTKGRGRGHHLYQLGLAYSDAGEHTKSQGALNEAKELGPEVLGAELFGAVVEAL